MEGKGLTQESYFSFALGNNLFSVPVTSVKEVINFSSITPVPNALPYLRGVMNIRGSVVSIVDLRVLFDIPSKCELSKTSVIVTEIPRSDGTTFVLGVIADQADVVSHLNLVPFDSADSGALPTRREFVKGAARRGDNFILILDLGKILDSIEAEIDGRKPLTQE